MPIVVGQQILPIAVAVTVGDGIQRRAQRAGGVGILRLTEDIAAVVVGVSSGIGAVINRLDVAVGIVGVGIGGAVPRSRIF